MDKCHLYVLKEHNCDFFFFKALSAYVPDDPQEPTIEERGYDCAAKIIAVLDQNREICRYGRNPEHPHLSRNRGAVLVFLPGLAEIEAMHKQLQVDS